MCVFVVVVVLAALHGLWDFSSPARDWDWTWPSAVKASSVEHWTPREVPVLITVVCKKFEIGRYRSSNFTFFSRLFCLYLGFFKIRKFRIFVDFCSIAIGIFICIGFNMWISWLVCFIPALLNVVNQWTWDVFQFI